MLACTLTNNLFTVVYNKVICTESIKPGTQNFPLLENHPYAIIDVD